MKRFKRDYKRLVISEDVAWTAFSNRTIMLYSPKNVRESFFLELDQSGTTIWKIIAKYSPTFEELISIARKKFKNIGDNKFEKDVLKFLNDLKKKVVIIESGKKRVSKETHF